MGNIAFGTYEPNREKTEKGKTVTVGVFFDGTLNNRKNTRARKAAKGEETTNNPTLNTSSTNDEGISERAKGIAAFNKEEDVSYLNDESNVSRLERFYKTDDTEALKVYVEGIGTDNFEGDAFLSKTMGAFSRGIGDKVNKACKTIVDKLEALKYEDFSDKSIDTLQFDVYGFSRGAAAARHFIYQVMRTDTFTLEQDIITGFTIDKHPKRGYLGQYLHNKVSVYKVKIRFVGLYETVASYGVIHWNDVIQLKLDKLNHAEKVVHITAQDEIRENFSLIDITSAYQKGLTITMPGVHSDIGGGYEENIKQEKVLLWDGSRTRNTVDFLNTNNVMYHFLLEGWFDKETIDKRFTWLLRNEVYGERKNLTNTYSVIPLQIMGKLSDDNKALIKKEDLVDDFNTNDDIFLKNIQKKLEQQLETKKEQSNYVELLPFDRSENIKNLWDKMVQEYHEVGHKYQARKITKKEFRSHYRNFRRDKNYLLEECTIFIDSPKELKELINKNWESMKSLKNTFEEYTLVHEEVEIEKENQGFNISDTPIGNVILNEVIVIAYKKDIDKIKKLRNKYLHISHTYENSGLVFEPLAPCFDYNRKYRKG